MAAVVEFHAKNLDPNSEQNVMLNALNHRTIIEKVLLKNVKPDIIVFPETGLNDFSVEKPVSTIIPSPSENSTPCPRESAHDTSSNLLETLSCTARMYKLYMVVNMLEKYIENDKTYFYNTNVAFNREGTIVGRYRKHNLYSKQSALTKPPSPEFSYFDTDFGVRFGMFTCFDIVFKTPALDLIKNYNISHFVFPTHWYSEMPFLTAIQAQYSWAASNDVVLLASGLNCPETGSTGSGVYIGADNSPTSYVQTATPSDIVIVRKVPKNLSHGVNDPGRVIYENILHPTTTLNMKSDKGVPSFKSELIDENKDLNCDSSTCRSSLSVESKTICQRDLCCHFSYTLESFYDSVNTSQQSLVQSGDDFGHNYYRLFAFDGVKDYDGRARGRLQICAVLSCTDKYQNIDSCGNPTYNKQRLNITFNGATYVKSGSRFKDLKISVLLSDNDTSIMPNVLFSRNPENLISFGSLGARNSFSFHRNSNESGMIKTVLKTSQSNDSTTDNIGVFAIYARIFEDSNFSNKAVPILSGYFILLMPVICCIDTYVGMS
ncbi:vanin-like protein 1 isoform X3 [Nilaparvata lugens]|uniref:vanin-like protein 1 isoform X3 n=1 Tax=Nilaparvata lugens TaxID=108931 RepID=UPI00193D4A6D|nr:vanin-like protein 1 isoform X3 [Nilaparvata lugens]